MKYLRITSVPIFLSLFVLQAQSQTINLWGELKPGPYSTGFKLIKKQDLSRYYPSQKAGETKVRTIRIYLWYPASETTQSSLKFETYLRLAVSDFNQPPKTPPLEWPLKFLPVPLAKGLTKKNLESLLENRTKAVRDADPEEGTFPLLILGQGLYYESPLSHIVLCEFLASHGYVVATCPLIGTHYRLVNLNVEDLETEIRDLEFVLSFARTLPYVDPEILGVIGYDLGGMAGLVLSMRNPDVDAFLSMDAGILSPHFSGLPGNHPQYSEKRFSVPWMHITQERFVQTSRDKTKLATLIDRKVFGDNYLILAKTTSHGDFSSYAMFGINDAVSGYWGPPGNNQRALYQEICHYVLSFFNGYLKKENEALSDLLKKAQKQDAEKRLLLIEEKKGGKVPLSEAALVHLIIEKGIQKAMALIEKTKAANPEEVIIKENVLNWLGYHFLYWWGREDEAVEVFKLNVSLFPKSANAYDSLGEAYLILGNQPKAVKCYEKSLNLDPNNKNAEAVLKRLKK
jgi:hypothetical protein